FVQNTIDHPATADVSTRLAAVDEEIGIVATGFFEGIGQDRHRLEVSVQVHLRRDPDGIFGAPRRIEIDGSEWIPTDITEESGAGGICLMLPCFIERLQDLVPVVIGPTVAATGYNTASQYRVVASRSVSSQALSGRFAVRDTLG